MADPTKKKYNVGQEFPCNRCGVSVVATEVMIRNHNYRCKKCRNEFVIKFQKENPDKVRQWDKNYQNTEAGKLIRKKSTTKYRNNNHEKYKAHWTVAHALKSGLIIKQPCEKCGNKKTHAHHENYSEPLKVKWLCPLCHRKEHKLLKQLE